MHVQLRPLQVQDISQVSAIEQEAFSPLWVATPFKRQLNNRFAKYLVAFCRQCIHEPSQATEKQLPLKPINISFMGRMILSIKNFTKRQSSSPQDAFIAGYVSIWFQGDEAHITEIAVRESQRNLGIGELLLIGAVRAAVGRGSTVITLEVRVSNLVAQSLYEKYGFRSAGLRKAYYADNREDALIMTTDPVHSQTYQRMFQHLKETYRSRRREIFIDC